MTAPDEAAASPPDPFAEIRLTTLHSTRGANFWSSRAVTRMDLVVGAYEDVSSADVPGVRDALERAMPGLELHRCSIGERGGFLLRLDRGTYAPHIIEHVALELQTMAGHDVGYGRTRGGDVDGEYTLVFEHMHEGVGLRAAAFSLEVVQRAFAGTLDDVAHMVTELRALAETPDVPRPTHDVRCAISGGAGRSATRAALAERPDCDTDSVVDVSPAYILQAGLPFRAADVVVVTDTDLTDVPERYRDPERARRLVGALWDALPRRGIAVLPARDWELQDEARDAGCRIAVFDGERQPSAKDARHARATAWPQDGRILVEHGRQRRDAGPLLANAPAGPQVAAALAAFTLDELMQAGQLPPGGPPNG